MAQENPPKRRQVVDKLRNKYRLVILNDDTFEEKLSLKLSRLNVFFIVGFLTIFLISSTILLIAFTPLREYIPGYSSTALRKRALELSLTTDSLQRQLTYNQRYLMNIRNIVEGKPVINFADTLITDSTVNASLSHKITNQEEQLREFVEEEERFNLQPAKIQDKLKNISFFTPVKGLVTNEFNPKEQHLGIDIVAKKNEVIKAARDGVVILAEWTSETGFVMIIQHPGDFISVYKHNSALLKEQGEFVEAGDPVAIIGNSGELTTGPHLHFELWYNGNPVNPQNYISF